MAGVLVKQLDSHSFFFELHPGDKFKRFESKKQQMTNGALGFQFSRFICDSFNAPAPDTNR